MPKIRFETEGDVEGHSAGREVEVEQMTMKTSDGDEITLEPEGEDGDRWRVVDGPDDLVGHMKFVSDRRLKRRIQRLAMR